MWESMTVHSATPGTPVTSLSAALMLLGGCACVARVPVWALVYVPRPQGQVLIRVVVQVLIGVCGGAGAHVQFISTSAHI
jgi:hypothetical protein